MDFESPEMVLAFAHAVRPQLFWKPRRSLAVRCGLGGGAINRQRAVPFRNALSRKRSFLGCLRLNSGAERTPPGREAAPRGG